MALEEYSSELSLDSDKSIWELIEDINNNKDDE